jgi:hypothetical protein
MSVFATICLQINPLPPNDHYSDRTAPLSSTCRILNIYSTNIRPEYFNTLRTGDANLRVLRYNCERRMTQNCLLTRAWFLRT